MEKKGLLILFLVVPFPALTILSNLYVAVVIPIWRLIEEGVVLTVIQIPFLIWHHKIMVLLCW
jgi:hypothetical protein